MILLIDGDLIAHQVASAVEEPIDWGDDWWSLTADFRLAWSTLVGEVDRYMERLGSEAVIFAFSDRGNNFRKSVLPTYKSNRRGKRKPVVYNPLLKKIGEEYKTVIYSTLEADDVLGLLSGGNRIIVSDDKDLRTIPGSLYRPSTDKVEHISDEAADRNHLIQTLTGDSVDGYKGCPGVGPVRAERILVDGTWEEVVGAYEKVGLTEEDALVQARVARILREGEYEEGKVILWTPEEETAEPPSEARNASI